MYYLLPVVCLDDVISAVICSRFVCHCCVTGNVIMQLNFLRLASTSFG